MSIKVKLHLNGKVELRERLSDSREVLRLQIEKLTRVFCVDNQITVCPPAFAAGCETPIAVRQAIRAGR